MEIVAVLTALSGRVSPSVMMPEHRLATLLTQLKRGQIANCRYHNTAASPSLYADHMCERANFPLQTMFELNRLNGEVWHVQFSHDGTRLASSGQDKVVVIYDVKTFAVSTFLHGSEEGVGGLSWSPDDSKIITCSQDKTARMHDCKVCHEIFPQHAAY